MKWLLLAAATMSLVMSCIIDRRSSELACETDADCLALDGPSRACNDGYCILRDCPDICDSCTGNFCKISCNSASKCLNLDCPRGFACAISCSQDCKNLECDDGCTVACSANADCGPIDCGAGETCICNESGNGTCL